MRHLEKAVRALALTAIGLTGACGPHGSTIAAVTLDEAQFDAVRRAGQGLRTAATVGITEVKYRDLAQACDVEAALAVQKARLEPERAIAARYVEMCTAYRDVLVIWDARSRETQRMGHEPKMGYINVSTPDLHRLVAAYDINKIPGLSAEEYRRQSRELLKRAMAGDDLAGPPISLEDQIDSNSATHQVWASAAKKLDKANERQ